MKRATPWVAGVIPVASGLLCAACGVAQLPVGASLSPTSQTTVACVGDSITAGEGVAQSETYPAQLQEKLGGAYVVLNFGHPGATANSKGDVPYVSQPEYAQALASGPNIVILMLGTNDARSPNDTPDLEATFEGDYEKLATSFVDLPSHPQVYLVTPIRVISDLGISEPILASLVRPQVRDVAAKLGLPLVEFETVLGDKAANYQADGIHPTSAGYDVMSTALYGVLHSPP